MEQRFFLPGTEWLYIELYSSECLANTIISKINGLLKNDNANIMFFYVRYNVPNFHLRLRFYSSNYDTEFEKKLMRLCHKMFNEKLFYDMKICTYKRELERYSIMPYLTTERYFCIETNWLINVFEFCPVIQTWELSIWLMNLYFDSLQLSIDYRIELLDQFSSDFIKEFKLDSANKKLLNQKFRSKSTRIGEIVEQKCLEKDLAFLKLKEQFINKACHYFEELIQLRGQKGFAKYICDIIHMANNRIFSDNNRLHEMIVYYWLHKYYKSFKAREQI